MPIILDSNQNHAKAKDTEVVNALPASMGMGGGYVPMIVEPIGADLFNQTTTGTVSMTMSNRATDAHHIPCVIEPLGFDSYNLCLTRQVGRTLSTPGGGLNEHIPCVIEPICFTHDTWMKINNEGVAYTVLERDNKNPQCVVVEDAESNRNA